MEHIPFSLPIPVLFGPGVSDTVGEQAKALGCRKLLIVCDQGIQRAGIAGRIAESVRIAGLDYTVDGRVEADPSDVSIDRIAGLAKAGRVDGIIAVGGGSTIDTAKCVKFLLCHEGKLCSYYGFTPGEDTGVPLIAVPTTAGTGSEVTIGAVVTDSASHTKVSVANLFVKAALAVVDPELTLGCPPQVTAACAFDVLAHAVDGCTSNHTSALTQNIVHNAVRLFMGSYQQVCRGGGDLRARTDMHMASVIGGIAILNGYVQACHAFAHTVGALYHVAHGAACAMFTGVCLEYVADIWPEEVRELAALLELNSEREESADAVARRLSSKLHRMAKGVGLPDITAYCPDEEAALREIVPIVLKDSLGQYCPRTIDAAGAKWILRRAFAVARED